MPKLRYIDADMADADPGCDGLEAVFLNNRRKLLGFIRHHGAGEVGEDLLQDIWLKIHETNSGPIRNPTSFLFRTAHNLVLDWRRSRASAVQRDAAWSKAYQETEVAPRGDRALIAREQIAAARATLASLGEPTATIFVRHRLDGDPQRVIARELGMGLSTVEKHLRKAYAAMLALRETGDDR